MTIILLSYPIDNNSPFYLGTTKPSIKPNNQIKTGNDYNTYIIRVENHCGTHVDAPQHFINSGKGISDYNINELTFKKPIMLEYLKSPGELIEVEDISGTDFEGYDCILFKTGFSKYREDNRIKYLTKNPGIAKETIQWLREKYQSVKCIGIDTISISRFNDDKNAKQTHITAFRGDEKLGDPLIMIEDMNLDKIENHIQIKKVVVVPWQINGIDSAPCTVIAYSNQI